MVLPFVAIRVYRPDSHAVAPLPSTSSVVNSIRPTGIERSPFHMSWIASLPRTGASPGGSASASANYTADAEALPPGLAPGRGRPAIQARRQGLPSTPVGRVRVTPLAVDGSGATAEWLC